MTLFFEDFEVGSAQVAGSRTITREEILDFARKFDPQPFHVDADHDRQRLLPPPQYRRGLMARWRSCRRSGAGPQGLRGKRSTLRLKLMEPLR
jgi:hypothetical protein